MPVSISRARFIASINNLVDERSRRHERTSIPSDETPDRISFDVGGTSDSRERSGSSDAPFLSRSHRAPGSLEGSIDLGHNLPEDHGAPSGAVSSPKDAADGSLNEEDQSDPREDPDWNPMSPPLPVPVDQGGSSTPDTQTSQDTATPDLVQLDGSSPRSSKRSYRFINRSPRIKPREKSTRREKWLAKLERMSEVELHRTRCCRSKKCFEKVNFIYFVKRAKDILSATPSVRRATLNAFKGSDDVYYFNGHPVCVRFLKIGFHFSSMMISSDRHSDLTYSDQCREIYSITPRSLPPPSFQSSGTNNEGLTVEEYSSMPNPLSSSSVQKLSIISFLTRLSEDCADKIPNKPEVHLPFFRREDVYKQFKREHGQLYDARPVPTQPYFLKTWRSLLDHIKVRRAHGFTVCDECEQLRKAHHDAIVKSLPTKHILEQKARHDAFISRERMAYTVKRDRARLEPSSYLSIIIDGADQSAFGLPHFVTSVKSARGHSLKVKLIGLLHHAIPNNLTLFTMTEDHETGANHIVETVHRFINLYSSRGPLPRTLYVQLDNCSRENKNHYLMAYLESLVALRVFDVVEAGFLPVGHTHDDIDQAFSATSSRLRANDAVTISDLHEQLSQTRGGRTKVTHMKRVANWSGLCNQEGCIKKISNITQYRYFKFSLSSTQSKSDAEVPMATQCETKRFCNDAWTPLPTSTRGTILGVLRFCPEYQNPPSTVIKCPEGKDEVIKRLSSEEGRINNCQKVLELHNLKDFVFSDRTDKFHWDLSTAIELKVQQAQRAAARRRENAQRDSGPVGEVGREGVSDHDDDINVGPVVESYDFDEEDEIIPDLRPQDMASPADDAPSAADGAPSAADDAPSHEAPSDQRPVSTQMPAKEKNIPAPSTTLNYEVGNFVVVKLDNSDDEEQGAGDTNLEFGIGRITEVEKQKGEQFARRLRIHWYDTDSKTGNKDPLSAKFFPCYREVTKKSDKRRKSSTLSNRTRASGTSEPWTDLVDTDTIVLTFFALKKNHGLPQSVQNKLNH